MASSAERTKNQIDGNEDPEDLRTTASSVSAPSVDLSKISEGEENSYTRNWLHSELCPMIELSLTR